ncbi:MAG TPA: DUF1127 domain-containing protein [Dongiaceae bacterium]|nr:DUF1127 domain-containing protein [Dongiaceae bacterium]
MKQLLQRLGLFVQRWQTYFRVRAELETYSERELHDMGMSSADINRVAREAAALAKPTGRFGQEAYYGARASHV